MKEERFSAFRLHKEHKGIIFLLVFCIALLRVLSVPVGRLEAEGRGGAGKICGVRRPDLYGAGTYVQPAWRHSAGRAEEERLFPFDPAEFSGAGGSSPDSRGCGIFSSICAVVGLFLGGSGRVRTQKERDKEWEKFAESGVGYAVNAEENAPALIVDNRRGRTEEAAMVLSGGLMASLSNLMLCGGMGEGKLPGLPWTGAWRSM